MSLLESVSSDSMDFNVRKFVRLFFDAASENEEDHNLEEEDDDSQEEKCKSRRNWLDFNNLTGLFMACKDKSFIIDSIDKLNTLAYGSNKQNNEEEENDDDEMLRFFSKNLVTLDFEIKFVKLLNDKFILCSDDKVYIEPYNPKDNLTSLKTKPISINDYGSITDLKVHYKTNKAFVLTSKNALISLDFSSSSTIFESLFDITKDQISCFDLSGDDLLVGHVNNNSFTKFALQMSEKITFEVKDIDKRMHSIDLVCLDDCKFIVTFDISGKADTADTFENLDIDSPRYSSYIVDSNNGTSQLIDEEFCSNSDINRDFKFYFVDLKKWLNGGKNDLFIITSTVASYLSPISSKTLYLAIEDEQKAAMPLDPVSYDDLFVSGISVDLLNSTEASVKRMESAIDSDFYPIVWILSSSGILTSFDFYDIDSIKQKSENIRNSTQLNILKEVNTPSSLKSSSDATSLNSVTSKTEKQNPFSSSASKTEKQNPFSSTKSAGAPSIFSGNNAFNANNNSNITSNNANSISTKNSTTISNSGKSSSSQTAVGSPGFGSVGFGSSGSVNAGTGFGQSGFGKTGFGQSGSSGFGQSKLGQSGFGQSGFGQSGFGQSGFGQSGFGQSGFGQSGFGSSGFGQSGFGSSGFGQSDASRKNPENTGSLSTTSNSSGKSSDDVPTISNLSIGANTNVFGNNTSKESPFASLSKDKSESKPSIFGNNSSKESPFASLSKDKSESKPSVFGNNASKESPFASLSKDKSESKPTSFGDSSSKESPFASLSKDKSESKPSVFGNSSSKECPFASLSKDKSESKPSVFGNNASKESPFASLSKDKSESKPSVFGSSSSKESPFASLSKDKSESKPSVFGNSSSKESPFASLSKDKSESKPSVFGNSSSKESPFASLSKDKSESKPSVFGNNASKEIPFASLNIGNKEEAKPSIFENTSSRVSPFSLANTDNKEEPKPSIFESTSSRVSPFSLANTDNKEEPKPSIFERTSSRVNPIGLSREDSKESSADVIKNTFINTGDVIRKTLPDREPEIIRDVKKANAFEEDNTSREEAFILENNLNVTSNNDSISQNMPTQYYLKEIEFPAEYYQKGVIEQTMDKIYYETLAEHRVLLRNFEDMESFKRNHSRETKDVDPENPSEIKDKYSWKLGNAQRLGKQIEGISVDSSKYKDLNANVGDFNSNKLSSLQTNFEKFVTDFHKIMANQIVIKKTNKNVQLPYEFEMLTKKLNSKVNHTLKLFEVLETKLLELKSKYAISYIEDESISKKLQSVTNQIESTLKQQMQEITILIKEVYQIRNFKQSSNPDIPESIENGDSLEDSFLLDEVSSDLLRLEVADANSRYMKRKSLINSIKKGVNLQD